MGAESCPSAGCADIESCEVTQVTVTAASKSFGSMFDCEGGKFEVTWIGEVNVSNTIVIGKGTTVWINGSQTSTTDEASTPTTDSDRTREGDGGLGDEEELIDRLSLPHGLTSIASGVAPASIAGDTDTRISFGPIFSLDGGQLFLQDLVVRDGYAAVTADNDVQSGAGVFAKRSIASITRCEFTNHFAGVSGGGLYVEDSILEVSHSTLSGCQAGARRHPTEKAVAFM